jgi:hypothetical protein
VELVIEGFGPLLVFEGKLGAVKAAAAAVAVAAAEAAVD